jgi:hypothetical protein
MVAYWELEEAGSPYADKMGVHEGSSLAGTPARSLGRVGYAQEFDGMDDYIVVEDHPDFDWDGSDDFTLEFWMKLSELPASTKVMVGRDDPVTQVNWWVGISSSGAIMFSCRGSNNISALITGSVFAGDNSWHHVTAVRDASQDQIRLYFDGMLEGEEPLSLSGNLFSTDPILIGGLHIDGAPSYLFKGSLDEIAIFNKAFTASEVSWDYNQGISGDGYCD